MKGAKLQFESNSQPTPLVNYIVVTCLWRVQSYNLKAIHNGRPPTMAYVPPVCEGCKVTIWKQFTTLAVPIPARSCLFVKGAKLQFESNSQPPHLRYKQKKACLWRVQSYNLKAIHNTSEQICANRSPVCEGCKVTIWKQFTTIEGSHRPRASLFVKGAKLQFESNSQLVIRLMIWTRTCLWRVQSYNLKAIHNECW